MSVVIVGGNDCMVRQYKELCDEHGCDVKVFTHIKGIKHIGKPDLLVLFTGTMSHKMLHSALCGIDRTTVVERSHSASMSALKAILKKHVDR